MNRKLILSIAATAMLSSVDAVAQVTYPKAPKDNTVDVYFGEKVADPYRWLEDDMSAQTAEWVDAENAVTRKYLDNIPMRKNILKRLKETANYEKIGIPFKRQGNGMFTATMDCRTRAYSTRWTALLPTQASSAYGSTPTLSAPTAPWL